MSWLGLGGNAAMGSAAAGTMGAATPGVASLGGTGMIGGGGLSSIGGMSQLGAAPGPSLMGGTSLANSLAQPSLMQKIGAGYQTGRQLQQQFGGGGRQPLPPTSPLPATPGAGLVRIPRLQQRQPEQQPTNPFYVNSTGRLAYRQPVPMIGV